jgi:palmitoyl-protein thioesterase
VRDHIAALLPGAFVHSLATGAAPGETSDIYSSYFGSVNAQVGRACDELHSLPALRGGYVAVGFSQGGQFLRAVAQRCQHLGPGGGWRMHTLVTMGSQHQGIMDVPG